MVDVFREPDLSKRTESLTVQRRMQASPKDIYRAWTEQFDLWFAAPGSVLMNPKVDAPFFFETEYKFETKKEAERHPHYGRFLELNENSLIRMTWVTGADGTKGAETIVSVLLRPDSSGTHLRLSHEGFLDEHSRLQHEAAWPEVLKQLDDKLLSTSE
ncbi:MAG: SRPBCC domain-containing protein [Aquisalinus sp.]|nr:SRPBCC domain-containing protein [Aquisalinus sp.]